ncbi:MAG: PEP/pyruvate-binding domain-containing protein [Syntrophobacteraceae bacterium]|nr:PEP/pyruvate-binding domain-containing protein [Syntrophobacteraceae bacterium]
MARCGPLEDEHDPRFKVFHELMRRKVREILLISTPYDASVMEEDCRLSEAIISEYRGLNLSRPPRLNWVSSTEAALSALDSMKLDLVIVMARVADANFLAAAETIKSKAPKLPVMLLCHSLDPALEGLYRQLQHSLFYRIFVWRGNSDLLLAMIKNAEDFANVEHDTRYAAIRVILCVEDSPEYLSSLLPIFYRELVLQTQAVMEEGLNNEHRLLAMRARPKILVADTFEGAEELFDRYQPYVFGVLSDVRFPRNNRLDENAGVDLLKAIRGKRQDIPALLMSNDPKNGAKAAGIPAVFVDKNSPALLSDIRSFFLNHLGFGDFVFRSPAGKEIVRVSNLRMLEKTLPRISEESFAYHCNRNDFSRWLFARSEIELAGRVRPVKEDDFSGIESHRQFLISTIHERRMRRQKGVIVDFDPGAFDEDSEIVKIGKGSLGGKARGLSFVSSLLGRSPSLLSRFSPVKIAIPQTLVVTTEVFDIFVAENNLQGLAKEDLEDRFVENRFLQSRFPAEFEARLRDFLSHFAYPIAVRSSSLLEDAQFRAYAGLYKTYMLPNNHADLDCRLRQLIEAIKLVYASTYFQGPKAFSRRIGHRTEEEKMAVIVQKIVGRSHGNYFYPAMAGVAQSYNYYCFSKMKPEEGIATIALGLGKTVMDGEKALRFSPVHPELLPQRSGVDDILENAQRFFYALKLDPTMCGLGPNDTDMPAKREVGDSQDEEPVRLLSSTYFPDEHCLRDSDFSPGYRVITFARVLKHGLFPLAQIVREVLLLGREGMGCPVELEFAADLSLDRSVEPLFSILQLRPMSAREDTVSVEITDEDLRKAFCVSRKALGNRISNEITDILLVKPQAFDPALTREIAGQIGRMNALLNREGRQYILIGPGRWGSADRWLGIPVSWADIGGAKAIVETAHGKLSAEPSQGSHFFHNIISLGINYFTVSEDPGNGLDWEWLLSLPKKNETDSVAWVSLERPVTIKVDGHSSLGVLIYDA